MTILDLVSLQGAFLLRYSGDRITQDEAEEREAKKSEENSHIW